MSELPAVAASSVEPRKKFYPAGEARSYRLTQGVRLIEIVGRTGLSLTRVSQLERNPELARPGELQIMKTAVDEIVSAREAIEARP